MIQIEKYQPIFPLVYLILAGVIAAVFHLLKVPDGVTGLIIGAALTRVKVGKQ
jgi:hypothetical protein